MSFRTIIITKQAKLETRLGYLIIRGEEENRVYIPEIETLILESTACTITLPLMCELVQHRVNVVFCDEKHLPYANLLPLYANYNCSKNIKYQIGWDEETKGKCWKLIVSEKIKMQSLVLSKYNHDNEALMLQRYILEIEENDKTNREGFAAKVYFNSLMGNGFSRDSIDVRNTFLNYGYAIILSCFSREIVNAGYLTQLGIWHRSETNFFNLSTDLMEPFRPIIDDFIMDLPPDSYHKKQIPNVMKSIVTINNEQQFLDAAIRIFVRGIINFMNNERNTIAIISRYELGKKDEL
ncbi:MAG: type II CRISPR-associated endonuclease Cas1 [Bacillales bacterium]|jgi:CRISPR-associated endonuclease Cas1 subtype II|nr:type II CRISPR-associated endonuclease Cas1 [Bacillales bacterium]